MRTGVASDNQRHGQRQLVTALTVALHTVPGGASADYASQGDYEAAVKAGLVDGALALTPFAAVKVVKAVGKAKGSRALGSGGRVGEAWDTPEAIAEYAKIRGLTDDVDDILRNTGLTNKQRLEDMKDYLFNNSEFAADPQIAGAWNRLRTGKGTADDMLLLKHETMEQWLRNKKGLGYEDAHNLTNERYNWQIKVDE